MKKTLLLCLASCWISFAQGSDAVKEASFTFDYPAWGKGTVAVEAAIVEDGTCVVRLGEKAIPYRIRTNKPHAV